jgi:beta-lactam-binding protein with PASTA domain
VPAAEQSAPVSLATTIAAKCVAPKLKGLTLKAAKQSIRAAGCGVGHVGKRKGVTVASGTVVKQTPTPGTSRPPGAKIAIKLG